MENNKKLPQQNFTRLTTAKLCQPAENNNRKLTDSQISNKPLPRNNRRRDLLTTSRNSIENFQRNYNKSQTDQQQQQVFSSEAKSLNAEKRTRKRFSTAINYEATTTVAAAPGNEDEGIPGVGGCLEHDANNDNDNNGSKNISINNKDGCNNAASTDCVAGNASEQLAASTGLNKATGKAAGKSRNSTATNTKKNINSVPDINLGLPGRKKQNQNHNHLLNFHYASLDVFSDSSPQSNHRGSNAKKYTKYNKEQFLQANFQFVIRMNAKPKFTASPDSLVSWDAIEQINIQTTEEPRCPICLYPPIAAKLTRCGHAYCWPCILHYLALSEKTWRRCPICFEAVHIGDLKSTSIVQQQVKNVDDLITLQLMYRQKGSLYIQKYEGDTELHEHFPYLMEAQEDQKRFSKFLLARRYDILQIIEREERELSAGMDEPDFPEFKSVQQALNLLQERREQLGDFDIKPKEKKHILDKKIHVENDQRTEQQLEPINNSSTQVAISNSKYYYFYQSIDGQNIYLHPLNIKMLQVCYGSLDAAPRLIEGHILQMEHYSMDEHTRKKFTCLGHLPLTRQFAVVELDLKPPIITDAVMQLFRDDIAYRKTERQRRKCEESKREKKINEINDRQMGKLIASTAHLNLSSAQEFPTCGFETPLGRKDATEVQNTAASASSASYSAAVADGGAAGSIRNAQLWPELGSPTDTLSCSYASNATWATKASSSGAMLSRNYNLSDRSSDTRSVTDDSDGERKLLSSSFHNTLSDVLAEAISQRQQKSARKDSEQKTTATKKSKKSKKMQPLFSTGMNFNGN